MGAVAGCAVTFGVAVIVFVDFLAIKTSIAMLMKNIVALRAH